MHPEIQVLRRPDMVQSATSGAVAQALRAETAAAQERDAAKLLMVELAFSG